MATGIRNDNGLRQKLMMMETAASHMASIRAQLRSNAELARKEIGNTIGHQLNLIRAREQLLLGTLEKIVDSKERILSEQQEELNQAIGACQQQMENLSRGNADNAGTTTMSRINMLDLCPRANSHLVFQCDPSDMRRAMYHFGEVYTDPSFKDRTDCLPLDTDEFEDAANLAHKSVLRMSRLGNGKSHPKDNDIRSWLAKSNSISESDGFEVIRNRLNSGTASSIEIIADGDDDLIGEQSMLGQWYLRSSRPRKLRGFECDFHRAMTPANWNSPATPKPSEPAPTATKPADVTKSTMEFEFGKIIDDIVKSKPDDWLIKKTAPQPTTILSPTASPSTTESASVEKSQTPVGCGDCSEVASTCAGKEKPVACPGNLILAQDLSHWLRDYPPKPSNRPINEMPPDLGNWESVLGWKGILEKLHGTGEDEWLVPASRKLESEKA